MAIGIQMAGPEPDPRDVRDRAVRLPGRAPARPGCGTAARSTYTPIIDIREIWWDPEAVSPFNGEPGTYRDTGQRWTEEEIPEGDPEVLP